MSQQFNPQMISMENILQETGLDSGGPYTRDDIETVIRHLIKKHNADVMQIAQIIQGMQSNSSMHRSILSNIKRLLTTIIGGDPDVRDELVQSLIDTIDRFEQSDAQAEDRPQQANRAPWGPRG